MIRLSFYACTSNSSSDLVLAVEFLRDEENEKVGVPSLDLIILFKIALYRFSLLDLSVWLSF